MHLSPSSTRRQRMAQVQRFFSSAGFNLFQMDFGTTPNMAPPSNLKKPVLITVSFITPTSLLHHTHIAELIYSLSDPFLWVHVLKFLRACHNGLLYLRRHPFHVGVRASKGFPDYSIDQFQRQHILAGQFQQLRGLLFEVPTAPQDRRTIFGRDDGIPGVLQHEDPVADRDTQCTTRCSFTYYDANHRYPQAHHFLEVMGNGFTLSSLFGFQPGKGSRSIDEGYYRFVEFFRDPH